MSAYVNSGTPQLWKYLYPGDGWRNLVETKHPWLSMVPKGDAATGGSAGSTSNPMGPGTGIIFTWNYSNPQSASLTHGSALAQQDSQITGTQLMCQLSQAYSYVRFNGKDLAASKNNMASFMNTQKGNVSKAITELGNQVDLALHRAGNGIIGTISAVSGNNITISNTTSIAQYQARMKIVSCSTAPTDGSAPTMGTGSATVTAVRVTYSNAQFSVILTLDSAAGFDANTNKYIAKVGNTLGFSATNTEGNIIGHENWVPSSSPATTESFLSSVNRSTDEIRLSGFRMDAGGRKYQEAISECNAVTHSMGGAVDIILANPLDMNKASIELGPNCYREEFKTGYAGFESLVMGGPAGGKLRFVGDPNQSVGTLRGMTLDTWKLFHLNALTHPMDEDGLLLRKDAGADAWQLALRSWPQQVCYEPYCNWVLTGF